MMMIIMQPFYDGNCEDEVKIDNDGKSEKRRLMSASVIFSIHFSLIKNYFH